MIVPKTDVIEWYQLDDNLQLKINQLINQLSRFLKEMLNADKVNVSTIGNVVEQMHVHVVGRKKDDFCWPDVIWGKDKFLAYNAGELSILLTTVCERFFRKLK